MPLGIPAGEGGDSPEVIALKAQVEQTARKYAREHNWCSVVNQALKEMGIEPSETINITVEGMVPFALDVAVPKAIFAGLSEDEEMTAAAKLLDEGSITYHPPGGVRRVPGTTAKGGSMLVASVEMYAGKVDDDLPEGYAKVFTSSEGRVAHILDHGESSRRRDGRWAVALCRAESYSWAETSARDEGRTCARCSERLAQLR